MSETKPELWTIDEVAAHIGASSAKSASKTLSRWGVRAYDYQPSAKGRPQARFEAEKVRSAHRERPGRGARTDLDPA